MAFLDKVVLPRNNLAKTPTATLSQNGFFSKIDYQPIEQKTIIEQPKELKFAGTLGTLAELQIDPLSLKAEPKKALSKAWEAIKTPVSEFFRKLSERAEGSYIGKVVSGNVPMSEFLGFSKPQEEPQKIDISKEIGQTLELTAGAGSVVFSPISAIFEGAKEIPVLGSVARLIELPFSAVGEGGAKLGGEIVDKLPISDEAKNNVKQGVEEIFALAGMLALGKLTHIGSKKYNELKIRFGEKDANTIVNKAVELAETKKAEVPIIKVPKKAPKTFLEKVEMPEVAKPVKKVGGVPEIPKGTWISDKSAPGFGVRGEVIGEGIIGKNIPAYKIRTPSGKITAIMKEDARIMGEAPIQPTIPKIEGEKPSKIALSIEERAIEKKLTEGFEGRAGYDPITIREQARLVNDLIKTDIEKAKRMIKGEEVIPENLRGGSLLVGLEEFALKKGDVNLLRELAKSPLVSETSRFGQEIRLLAERSPESPVKIIQDVIKTREIAIEKRTGKKPTDLKKTGINEIKTEIKKIASKRPTWEEFIKDITC